MRFLRFKAHIRAGLWLQLVFLISLLLEGLAIWRLLSHGAEPDVRLWAEAAALHLLAAAVPLCWRYNPRRYPAIGWYLPKLTGLVVLFLPVIGIIGMSATVNATSLFVRSKGLAHEFEQSTYHLDVGDEAAISRSMDDMLREELATEPIVDILSGDDDDLKRGAIQLLKRMKSTRAIALLKDSLSDSSPEVRFFAHTALAQLEEDAVERLEKAEERASSGDAEAVHRLAITYLDYARSGLPEDTMRRYYLEEGRKSLERFLSMEKTAYATLIELGMITLEQEEYMAAHEYFSRALDYPETEIKGRLGRLWVYYEQRNFVELAREMRVMRGRKPADGAYQDEPDDFSRALFNFWASDTGAAPPDFATYISELPESAPDGSNGGSLSERPV